MSLHKLTAGDGYEYLTKQVAAQDSTELGRDSLESYYSDKGEAPGQWLGSGLDAFESINAGDLVSTAQMKALFGEGRHPDADAIEAQLIDEGMSPAAAMSMTRLGSPFKVYTGASEFRQQVAEALTGYNHAEGKPAHAKVPDDVKARIRTDIATGMFEKTYGRSPADAREISGFIAQQTRQKTTAVAGYDLTFTPPKSFSTLWAIAPRETSAKVEAAHDRAVRRVVASIERDGAYTRIGTNGARQVKARGLIAAAFTHRDSRAGDPNLHTHVPISNKVQAVGADGALHWYALDGTVLHKKAVAYSEEYNTAFEEEMLAEFPAMQIADRAQTVRGKRPVREIVGVPQELITAWSSRRTQIEKSTAELITAFQSEHGREPTTVEQIALQQQANLATRQAKHEPRSFAEQRAAWAEQAISTLGSRRKVNRVVAEATGVRRGRSTTPVHRAGDLDADWFTKNADHMVSVVSKSRSVWQPHHLTAEALRITRATAIAPEDLHAVRDRLVATALGECVELAASRYDGERGEPMYLRDDDGRSAYARVGADYYTNATVMAEEQQLIAAATTSGGRIIDPIHVDIALLEQEANKYKLNAGQEALVREFAGSGARLQLALAPAGTGKTSAMSVFTAAWSDAGGHVVGLAPSANAAEVLRADIGHDTDTIDKYVQLVELLAEPDLTDAQRSRILDEAPDWFTRIGPGTVIVVDEAGMAGRANLYAMTTHALASGADVKLIGDDRQLASVDAGGVLRDIAATAGALTLTDVVRFHDDAQAAASLALREGKEEAIGYYLDAHRVHVSGDATAGDLAYAAWLRDTDSGADSVMLAPTLDTVSELNTRAREEFVARRGAWSLTDRARGRHRELTLADGLRAGVGDTVITKKNRRALRLSPTDYVRNGYRFTITEVHKDGHLSLRHTKSGQHITVPDWYVNENVVLGYASTVHGAQGITVGSRTRRGTCHVIGGSELERELAYVGLTRATDENHLYFSTAESDPHKIVFQDATHPPTAVDVMRGVLAREGAQSSATTLRTTEAAATTRLKPAAEAYRDAIGAVAEHHIGAAGMAAIDAGAARAITGLTDDASWPVLRAHLAAIAVSGRDPIDALTAAAAERELGSARDRAAVLDWRLDPSAGHSAARGPLPWLPHVPDALRSAAEGPFLARRDALVRDLAGVVAAQAAAWTVTDAPRWARPLLAADGDHTALVVDIAVFRSAHGVDDLDARPTGPEQYAVRTRRHQNGLTDRYESVLGTNENVARWSPLLNGVDRHIATDPFFPELADNLTLAAHAGHDVARLVLAETFDRALPTELPAAALWFRLAPHIAPATLDTAGSQIRPAWTPLLHELFGGHLAEVIVTDHGWPALVTAVSAAHPAQWNPRQLLTVAGELLTAGTDGPVAAGDYARGLAWRINLLAEYTAYDAAHPIPVPAAAPMSVEDEERLAHLDPNPDALTVDELTPAATATGSGDEDSDYLDALAASEPPPADVAVADRPTVDELADLEFTDLATARPGVLDESALVETDTELAELRAAHAAAVAEADALAAAVAERAGPATQAATADIARLRQLAEAHRPMLADLAHAHDAWIDADLAAAAAHNRAAEVERAANAARAVGDYATAIDLDTELFAERSVAAAADAHLDTAAEHLAAVSATISDHAPAGAVTADDLTRAITAAHTADTDALLTARAHVDRLGRRVIAAENTARRRGGVTGLTAARPATTDGRAASSISKRSAVAVATRPTLLAGRYRTHLDALTRARHTRAAAAVTAALGSAAAAAVLADPAELDRLAAVVDAAHAAGIDPIGHLAAAAGQFDTVRGADLAEATKERLSAENLRATRTFEHLEPHRFEAFTAADRGSAAWADTVETIRRQQLHGNGTADQLATWLTINVDNPAAATADELAATLHQRYPVDAEPIDRGPAWLPTAPLGVDPADAADIHRNRAELVDAITTRETAGVDDAPWRDLLPPRPERPGPEQQRHDEIANDIALYRDLAGVDPTDARPLGGPAPEQDHATVALRDELRHQLTDLEEPAHRIEHTPPPAPEHIAPPAPEIRRGPRM